MQEQKPEKIKITFDEEKINRYFPKNYSKKQIEDTIIRLLEQYRKQQIKKKNQMER